MRRADYRTTLKHYTVIGISDTGKAINQLSPIKSEQREAATGTCDINTESKFQLKSQLNGRKTVRHATKRCESTLRSEQGQKQRKLLPRAKINDKIHRNSTPYEKPAEGVEPATTRLQGGSSTVELRWQFHHSVLYRPVSVKTLFTKRRSCRIRRWEGTEMVINSC